MFTRFAASLKMACLAAYETHNLLHDKYTLGFGGAK